MTRRAERSVRGRGPTDGLVSGTVLPLSVAEYYSQPGLVYLPIADTTPYELCIAVIKNRRQQHLRELVKVAVAALAGSTTDSPGANGDLGAPAADRHAASGKAGDDA